MSFYEHLLEIFKGKVRKKTDEKVAQLVVEFITMSFADEEGKIEVGKDNTK